MEESLSEDQEMNEEPASSFCGSCDSPIETIEESRPDSYESLKEQLQQAEAEITSLNNTDETSKGKFTKTRVRDCHDTSHCCLTYSCRASH